MGIIKNIKLIPKTIEKINDIINKLDDVSISINVNTTRVLNEVNKIGQDSNINFHNISNRLQKNENNSQDILHSLERISNDIPLDTSINEDWLKAKEDGILYMINKSIESLGYCIGVNEDGEAIIMDIPIKISLEDNKIGLKKYINYLEKRK